MKRHFERKEMFCDGRIVMTSVKICENFSRAKTLVFVVVRCL